MVQNFSPRRIIMASLLVIRLDCKGKPNSALVMILLVHIYWECDYTLWCVFVVQTMARKEPSRQTETGVMSGLIFVWFYCITCIYVLCSSHFLVSLTERFVVAVKCKKAQV